MSATFTSWFKRLGWLPKLVIIVSAAYVFSAGIVGTVAWIDGLIAHQRDRVTDAKIEASDRRIEELEKENAGLIEGAAANLKEVARLKVEIDAKDQLINQASDRIKQSDRKIEEIISDFQSETDRINQLSPDAVDAELRARLKAAGRLKD